MPLLKDEPPLAGYLRILAKETHLTVVSYWPQDDHRALYRMPSSIVRQTIPQALGYLCYIYHCDWTQDGTAVRFRAKP